MLARFANRNTGTGGSNNTATDAYRNQLTEITKAWTDQNEVLQQTLEHLEHRDTIIKILKQKLVDCGVPKYEIDHLIESPRSDYKDTYTSSSSSSTYNNNTGSIPPAPPKHTVSSFSSNLPIVLPPSSSSSSSTTDNIRTNEHTYRSPDDSSSPSISSLPTVSPASSPSSSLLSHSTPAAYARESPFSYAALNHLDSRVSSMEESLRNLVTAARDYETAGIATVTAADRFGTTLISISNQSWCMVPGGEDVCQALSRLGHCIRDCAALSQAANTTVHHAFGTSMEVDLLPAANRTRILKSNSESISEEAEIAILKLINLKKGSNPNEVLSRTSEVVQALHRAELTRFDATALFNSLEARRRIILLEKTAAASSAIAGYFAQAFQATSQLDIHMRAFGEATVLARKRALARDTLWRLVRDALETDLIRTAGLSGPVLMPASTTTNTNINGNVSPNGIDNTNNPATPSIDTSIYYSGVPHLGLQLLKQATLPIDKLSDAVLKASLTIQSKADTVDGAPLSNNSSTGSNNNNNNENNLPPHNMSALQQLNNLSNMNRISSTLSSASDVPIAGWLFRRNTSGKHTTLSSSSSGTSSSISNNSIRYSGWSRRWFFVRHSRLYMMTTDSLAPSLLADLATCNIREGTTDDEDSSSSFGSGAIGVVGISGNPNVSLSPNDYSGGFSSSNSNMLTTPNSSLPYSSYSTGAGNNHVGGAENNSSIGKMVKNVVRTGVGFAASAVVSSLLVAGGAIQEGNSSSSSSSSSSSTGSSATSSSSSSSSSHGGIASDALPMSYSAAHAFEIRTPSRILILAAPTMAQRKEWVRILRELAEAALTVNHPRSNGATTGTGNAHGQSNHSSSNGNNVTSISAPAIDVQSIDIDALKERLRTCTYTGSDIDISLTVIRYQNRTCCDCGAKDPDWASLNIGNVFCLACSGVHRSLGVHISKVRSLILDSWEPAHLLVLLGLGNTIVNRIYEPRGNQLTVSSDRNERDKIIRAKYELHSYICSRPKDDIDEKCVQAAAEGNLGDILLCLAHGAQANRIPAHSGPNNSTIILTTALHAATKASQIGSVALLMGHQWDGMITDSEGYTPLETYIISILQMLPSTKTESTTMTNDPMNTSHLSSSSDPEEAHHQQHNYDYHKVLDTFAHILIPKRLRAHAIAISEAALSSAQHGDRTAALNILECEKRTRSSSG